MLRIHPASMTLSHSFRFSVLKKVTHMLLFSWKRGVDRIVMVMVSIFTELNNRLLGDIYNN